MADPDQTPPDAGAPNDAGTTPPPDAPAAPAAPEAPAEWPKEFFKEDGSKDTEAMAKSYSNLRNHMAATRKDTPAPTSLALPEKPALDDGAGLDDVVRAAGLDPTEVVQQFRDRQERDGVGSLTPAFYKALKTQDMKKGMIDPFLGMIVEKQKTAQAALLSDASTLAGGDEQRDTVRAWAGDNLSKGDLAYFNANAGDIRTFEWLMGKYKEAVGAGSANPLITGGGTPAAPTGGFTSQADLFKAQNDPKYETNKAYRAAVNARIEKTDVKVIHGFA